MKWMLLLVFVLVFLPSYNPLWAAAQYTQAQCDHLKQQKEQLRKKLNSGYSFAEGERLDKKDRQLFQQIAAHCSSPVSADTSNDAADNRSYSVDNRHSATTYANVSLQEMPAWSGRNAIFQGDKAAAWTEFYQVPTRCRQKQLSEDDFVACADHKALQRLQFEHKWQQLKFSPMHVRSIQAIPSPAEHQSMQHVVTAYTVKPTSSANSPAPQPSASRYVDNIQQQFNWVGMSIIGILAALSWLIWRKL